MCFSTTFVMFDICCVGMLSIWKMVGCVNTITAKDVFQAHEQGIEQGVCLKSHFVATLDILILNLYFHSQLL